MNLYGTLHPDSVGLAEAMIKEYMKISSKFHELDRKHKDLEAKMKNSSVTNSSSQEDHIDMLNQKTF